MLTACKQYSPAAGATQSYIAYTQNVTCNAKRNKIHKSNGTHNKLIFKKK